MKALLKKSFAVLLSAVLLLSVLPFTVSAAEIVDSGTTGDCTWTLSRYGTLTIRGNGAMEDYEGYASNPWVNKEVYSIIIENGVTRIGNNSFSKCSAKSVVIPDSVTSIGIVAFADCFNLTTVSGGDNVTDIGEGAFRDSLWYDNQPDELIYFGKTVYQYKGAESCPEHLEIKSGMLTIQNEAFFGCSGLKSIEIPDSVTRIGEFAFADCGLTSVCIPDSVTDIGFGAFTECEFLTNVILSNNLTRVAARAFKDCSRLTGITIPNSVTGIGYETFAYCSGLTEIFIPDTVTSISDNAFIGCNNLTVFGKSGSYAETYANQKNYPFVAVIDFGTTGDCTWTLDSEGTLTISGNGYMGNNEYEFVSLPYEERHTYLDSFYLIRQVIIEDGVKNIGFHAFGNCFGLTSVSIPDSVVTIDKFAFENCSGLTSVSIPDSVVTIDKFAFENCSGLTSVSIPDSVVTIDDSAFENCSGLTSVSIPSSVTTIGLWAFKGCSALTSLAIPKSVMRIGTYAFEDCPALASITVDSDNTTYDSRENCNAIIETNSNQLIVGCKNTVIPETVKNIGTGAFEGCTGLTSIIIPGSVETIDTFAFYGCSGLTNVSITDGVKSINDFAFEYCSGLNSIYIPKSVLSIGSRVFEDMEKLASITVAPDNTVYDSRNNCNAIIETDSNQLIVGCKNTVIPDSVTSIGEYAFAYCDGLTSITIPDSVTSIGKNAFASCDGLTSITIPGSVTDLTSRVVAACDKLKSVTILFGVKSIGWAAFQHCSGLTNIMIPESVTSIDKDAFFCCENLTIYGISGSYAETYANENNIPFVAVTDFGTTGDCIWTLDSTGTLTVSGDGKMANYPNSLNLPWKTTRVKSAVFKDGVTSIGKCAFKNNTALQSVTVPDSVTAINSFAFYGCTDLKTVTIPSGVTSIGNSAFGNCTDLTICGTKGSYAERYAKQNNIPFTAVCPFCNSTETEIVPAVEATQDHDGATEGLRCTHCNSWIIEPTVIAKPEEEIVDSGTTGDCTWTLDSAGTLTVSGNGKMGNYSNSLNLPWGSKRVKAVVIENGVTGIGKCAFKNNKGLQSITIPGSVTAINSFAFYGCTSLQTVTVPASVTSIGISSFSYCNSLTVFGEKGSYAESYTTQSGIPFVPVCPVCGSLEFVEVYYGPEPDMQCIHCGEVLGMPEAMALPDITVGDINGNHGVDIEDATMIQRFLAEFIELDLEDEKTFLQADVNGDGYVNVKDVTAVQRKVAELM